MMREEAEHFVAQLRIIYGESCVGEELLVKEVRVAAERAAVGESGQGGQEALKGEGGGS